MNELQMFALHRMSMMSEQDRRTTEETAGRMFSGLVRALRRLRGVRAAGSARPAVRAAVCQPGTSAR